MLFSISLTFQMCRPGYDLIGIFPFPVHIVIRGYLTRIRRPVLRLQVRKYDGLSPLSSLVTWLFLLLSESKTHLVYYLPYREMWRFICIQIHRTTEISISPRCLVGFPACPVDRPGRDTSCFGRLTGYTLEVSKSLYTLQLGSLSRADCLLKENQQSLSQGCRDHVRLVDNRLHTYPGRHVGRYASQCTYAVLGE